MPTESQKFLHRFRNSWKIILTVIIAAPLIKWFFLVSPGVRFATLDSTLGALGQVAGLTGTLLFSFSLILSFRNRFTEIIFGGLDKLYRIHHLSGMWGFFILLLHPLLVVAPIAMYSMKDAASFFTPFKNGTPLDLGIFALLSFMLLIGITLFGVIFSYQTLKKFHKFLGLAFLLGAVHGLMMPSDIQRDTFIFVWMVSFIFLGLSSYIIYSLGKKFTVRKKLFTIKAITKVESNITEVSLAPKDKGVFHLPGQFAFFSFVDSRVMPNDESHPFTISSWENNGEISFSGKGLGDFTSLLSNEVVGTTVGVHGPFGEFVYGYRSDKQVWVAGGVGVTPFVSFARHMLTVESLPYAVEFFYSVRTKEDLAYHALFTSVAERHKTFVYHPMPSDTEGFITGEVLVNKVSDITERDIFICGPPGMMNALMSSLTKLGVTEKQIHSELFSLLK
jgi:predicted ferric reductase